MSLFARLKNIAVAVDQLVNTILGGLPQETLSGSVGRAVLAGKPWAPFVRDVLDGILGKGHCASIAAIEARQHQFQQHEP